MASASASASATAAEDNKEGTDTAANAKGVDAREIRACPLPAVGPDWIALMPGIFDATGRVAYIDDQMIELSARELSLLEVLLQR